MILTIPGYRSALLNQQYLNETRDQQVPAFEVACRCSKPAPRPSVRKRPTVVFAVILLCCHWLLSCTDIPRSYVIGVKEATVFSQDAVSCDTFSHKHNIKLGRVVPEDVLKRMKNIFIPRKNLQEIYE
jgi:hypothetical protein